MSVHRTYLEDISKIMTLTTIPKENWNETWRDLAQDTMKWKKLTKKWLVKQRHEEKNKVWIKQAEITPGGKTFHRAEKQRRDQQRAVEENLTINENKRIECPHCRSKFVIGKFLPIVRYAATSPSPKETDKTTAGSEDEVELSTICREIRRTTFQQPNLAQCLNQNSNFLHNKKKLNGKM